MISTMQPTLPALGRLKWWTETSMRESTVLLPLAPWIVSISAMWTAPLMTLNMRPTPLLFLWNAT